MTLTFEFASFTVREGEEGSLVAERPAMIAALNEAFPGLIAAWLTKQDDGTWMDTILWETRAAAEDAAAGVNDVAEARQWFSHIASSHRPRGLKPTGVVAVASSWPSPSPMVRTHRGRRSPDPQCPP